MTSDHVLINSRNYQICSRCIMDTSASDIQFDSSGVCNYCREYFEHIDNFMRQHPDQQKALNELAQKIKNAGRRKEYDCIVGVSGGLDSSYVIYVVKKLGLKPLAIHLDNGWNSELAVSNIERLCKNLNVDLFTHVIDWEEFKDLQIAFFKAGVVDIELLSDHAISAILYKIAFRHGIKYIIAGTNMANEGIKIPPSWSHFKKDLLNLQFICKKFSSNKELKTFPTMGLIQFLFYRYLCRIHWVSILDHMEFQKNEAIQILTKEVGWRPYEKKHYESIFTRFYQGYILPVKFHIDKRRLHYSTLICSNQMTRAEALSLMQKSTYDDQHLLEEDKIYVLKKLGIDIKQFEEYLQAPSVPHSAYPSEEKFLEILVGIRKFFKKLIR